MGQGGKCRRETFQKKLNKSGFAYGLPRELKKFIAAHTAKYAAIVRTARFAKSAACPPCANGKRRSPVRPLSGQSTDECYSDTHNADYWFRFGTRACLDACPGARLLPCRDADQGNSITQMQTIRSGGPDDIMKHNLRPIHLMCGTVRCVLRF